MKWHYHWLKITLTKQCVTEGGGHYTVFHVDGRKEGGFLAGFELNIVATWIR